MYRLTHCATTPLPFPNHCDGHSTKSDPLEPCSRRVTSLETADPAGRGSPWASVPKRRVRLHHGTRSGESDLEMDAHGHHPRRVGRRLARVVEVAQPERAHAVDNRLRPTARIASQRGLLGAKEIRDALACRVHHAVAIDVILKRHESG